MEDELKLQKLVFDLIRQKMLHSCHDVADGGLFVALFESARVNHIGFNIQTDAQYRKDAYLFGESQSRVVVSISKRNQSAFEDILSSSTVTFRLLGQTIAKDAIIDGENYGQIDLLDEMYSTRIEKVMNQ
jgi:phosphoribosylformylglycinamidine synthase